MMMPISFRLMEMSRKVCILIPRLRGSLAPYGRQPQQFRAHMQTGALRGVQVDFEPDPAAVANEGDDTSQPGKLNALADGQNRPPPHGLHDPCNLFPIRGAHQEHRAASYVRAGIEPPHHDRMSINRFVPQRGCVPGGPAASPGAMGSAPKTPTTKDSPLSPKALPGHSTKLVKWYNMALWISYSECAAASGDSGVGGW